MNVGTNLCELNKRISRACQRAGRSPTGITIVAVTKTVEVPAIKAAFKAGIRHFGENRVQEARGKIEQLADLRPDITWHMIGHLQSNKARAAVDMFDMIHSIDSIRLAEEVSRRAQTAVPILLQVNIASEVTKSGLPPSGVIQAVERISRLPRLDIKGLMTIAPLTDDPEDVRPVFQQLRLLRDSLGLEHLSMGMTDDFEVAIEEGATMLRIGRAIFGERNTN